MRYITPALVAATLLATTSVYAQQGASPAPQGGTTTSNPSASSSSSSSSDQDQVSRRLTRQIQSRLKQQGYLDKSPDGQWDNNTSEALADFQDASGLQSTGQLDGMTIYILGISTPPNGGGSAMQSGPATGTGGAMTQSAAQQPQQQSRYGGPDLHQVLIDTYDQGYQQGLTQGYRQGQSASTSQTGASQGGSQQIVGPPTRTKQ